MSSNFLFYTANEINIPYLYTYCKIFTEVVSIIQERWLLNKISYTLRLCQIYSVTFPVTKLFHYVTSV